MNTPPEVADTGQSPASPSLIINEIFFSIQGESSSTGAPTIFIRLTGCPLRCHYCDTEYAFHSGNKLTIDEILQDVTRYQTKFITVTGGEPLAQKNAPLLLQTLNDSGYLVSLETSGAIDIQNIDPRTRIILDVKTPGSGEADKNLLSNLDQLKQHDEIKFVLTGREDYLWAMDFIRDNNLQTRLVYFSPAHDTLPAQDLAEWIIQDQSPVRLQIQLHKILWGNTPGK